jgi:hypothetical protein
VKPEKKTLLFLCWSSVKHHKFKQQVLLLFIKVFLSFSKRTKKKSVNMTVTYFLFLWEAPNIDWGLISNFSESCYFKTFIIASWRIKLPKSWSLALKKVLHGEIIFLSKVFGGDSHNFLFLLESFWTLRFQNFQSLILSIQAIFTIFISQQNCMHLHLR